MEREAGYYWVNIGGDCNWEPASWNKKAGTWSLHGLAGEYEDDEIHEIGDRIEPPKGK